MMIINITMILFTIKIRLLSITMMITMNKVMGTRFCTKGTVTGTNFWIKFYTNLG